MRGPEHNRKKSWTMVWHYEVSLGLAPNHRVSTRQPPSKNCCVSNRGDLKSADWYD